MKKIKFYDTSSLLLKADSLFDSQEEFAISSITLKELENIKSSAHKDVDIKYAARKLVNKLNENIGKYKVVLYTDDFLAPLLERGMDDVNNDLKILACGFSLKASGAWDVEFVTNDICLKHLAMILFSNVTSVEEVEDDYLGYKHLILTEEEMLDFYSNQNENTFDLLTNQYGIFYNEDKEIVDIRRWDGESYQFLDAKPISSKYFGRITPQDLYQKMALDSLRNNQLTVLRGRAGSGKSLLGLSFLFSLLEQYKIDRLYIFCNPVATRDSARLGFYPGSKDQKLLDSQIGNFLVSKLGDITAVEQLIDQGKLILIPAADSRGVDIPENSGVYITEAQNSTRDLMRLLVQRIGEGTKVVIEGDDRSQVDLNTYAGVNNGLKALSKAFRGEKPYGEVRLQQIHRSELTRIAERI